jgi:hypothetical protein
MFWKTVSEASTDRGGKPVKRQGHGGTRKHAIVLHLNVISNCHVATYGQSCCETGIRSE